MSVSTRRDIDAQWRESLHRILAAHGRPDVEVSLLIADDRDFDAWRVWLDEGGDEEIWQQLKHTLPGKESALNGY